MNFSNTDGVRDKSYRDYWTKWYNVDSPWDDGGDYETTERILKVYNKICNKGFQICAAQCQVRGHESQVFDKDTYPSNTSDVLERHCTTEGIICRNGDQSSGSGWCQDYQIQFRCQYTGDIPSSPSYFSPFDIRIYVILALVPLLLVFCRMLWVYVYRRHQHRDRNHRLRESNRNNVNKLSKAPPTYQELFCKNGSSVFTISRENLPVCSLCQFKPCSVALIINETKDSEKPNRKNQPGEAGSILQMAAETNTGNSTANTVGLYSINVAPRGLNLSQVASSSQAIAVGLDSSEITNFYTQISPNKGSLNHETVSETSPANGENEVNISNVPAKETRLDRNIQANPQPSLPSTSFEVHPGNSQLAISLNPDSLKSSNISEPCACECHRTVPSKQEGVSGCDNPGYTTDGTESNKQSVYVSIHRPVFDNAGVQLNIDLPATHTQLELPSYEYALQLIKRQESGNC